MNQILKDKTITKEKRKNNDQNTLFMSSLRNSSIPLNLYNMAFNDRTGNFSVPITYLVPSTFSSYLYWRRNVQILTNYLQANSNRRRVLLNSTSSDYNTIYLSPVLDLVRERFLFQKYFEDFKRVVVNLVKRERALKMARLEEMEYLWLRLENAMLARRSARTLYTQTDKTAKSLIIEALRLRVTFEHILPFTTFNEVSTDIYIRERQVGVSYA